MSLGKLLYVAWSRAGGGAERNVITIWSADHRDLLTRRHLSSLFTDGFPQFNEKFGELGPDGTYQVPARWQAGLSNVSRQHTPRGLKCL